MNLIKARPYAPFISRKENYHLISIFKNMDEQEFFFKETA